MFCAGTAWRSAVACEKPDPYCSKLRWCSPSKSSVKQIALRRSAAGRRETWHSRKILAAHGQQRQVVLAGSQDFSELVSVAEEAVEAASKVTLKYFRSKLDVLDKEDTSPVTIADSEAESAIRQVLKQRCPNQACLGEESGYEWPGEAGQAEYLWVIDPIDGTKSFITGKPLWGTLLALLHNGEPVLGIIDQPYIKERWVGIKGRPTTLNGQEVKTKTSSGLSEAYLYATSPHMFEEEPFSSAWDRLRTQVKLPLYGCDCYAYGLLAAGHADLVAECDMKPYDYLALVPIIQGAGGVITDWEGGSLKWPMLPSGAWADEALPGEILAAANPELHAAALKALEFGPEDIDPGAHVSYSSVTGPGN